jgi:orotate phosphoribosyltransferase
MTCRTPIVSSPSGVDEGGQVIESCRLLRERHADIAAVLCVIDREAGGPDNRAAESLPLRSLFTMSDLQRAGGA